MALKKQNIINHLLLLGAAIKNKDDERITKVNTSKSY